MSDIANHRPDERLTHRLEAFSDLVIGFSLALVGATLVVPGHVAALQADPWWIITYFWTFFVISLTWFNHQRLFSAFFDPTPVAIVLNFIVLSMLGLIVFFVQVFGRLHGDADRIVAFLCYFVALGVVMFVMGVLFTMGTRSRWAHLSERDRRRGIRYSARGLVLGLAIFAGVISTMNAPRLSMDATLPIAAAVIAGGVAVRLGLRLLKQRIDEAVRRNISLDHHA